MDIRVGDRITYKDMGITMITSVKDGKEINDIKTALKNNAIEIIKIERLKYEVIEERKQLLTEEEKEFLRIYEKVMKFKITEIEKEDNRLYIWDMGSNYEIEIDESVFKNLENEKTYNAEELGLEE